MIEDFHKEEENIKKVVGEKYKLPSENYYREKAIITLYNNN